MKRKETRVWLRIVHFYFEKHSERCVGCRLSWISFVTFPEWVLPHSLKSEASQTQLRELNKCGTDEHQTWHYTLSVQDIEALAYFCYCVFYIFCLPLIWTICVCYNILLVVLLVLRRRTSLLIQWSANLQGLEKDGPLTSFRPHWDKMLWEITSRKKHTECSSLLFFPPPLPSRS